jgi:eukaryotic-like serine/threonine-protein kinase
VERIVKLKGNKTIGLIFLLVVIIIATGLVGGCMGSGIASVGWSGVAVAGDFVYVGTNDGKQGMLVSVKLEDNSILSGKPIIAQSSGGLLSCACGNTAAGVPIYGTPVVYDNKAYIAGYNGKIYAYRADNLASLWSFPESGYYKPFVGSIVVHNGKLYIGCSDGFVYSLDAETGKLLYKFQTGDITKDRQGDKIWGTPTVDPITNTLFIGCYDKYLYALNLDDLTLKWSYATGGSIMSAPLVDNGIVYFGSFDRNLYALNSADGNFKWKFAGKNWFWAAPKIYNGVLYSGCMDNFVYAINPETGASVHDAYNLQSAVASSPVIVDNFVIVISNKGVLFKIDTVTMEMQMIKNLNANINSPLMAYNGIVYIHPAEMVLERINPVTGAELQTITLQK